MSLIKASGAGDQSTGFYKHLLDQSLKFNDDDSQYLSRTFSAGNLQTWTWSAWVKRGTLGAAQILFGTQADGSNIGHISFQADDTIKVNNKASDSTGDETKTVMVFRDASAWYHIVIAFDGAQSTQANRTTFYVNGVEQSRTTVASKSAGNGYINTAVEHTVGTRGQLLGAYFDGYLAEVNFIDGQALTPTSFGETKNGIWIPKDTSGLTFGTNGFHLTFKDDVVSEGFNTVTYSGRGAVQSVSGLGFSPAMVWTKERDGTSYHEIHDIVRGANKQIFPNATDAEESTTKLTSFDGDGFSLAAHNSINESGKTYVGWCWEAGGAPTADNSAGAGATPTAGSVKIDGSNLGSALAGTIAATRLSADTSKGFSVVTYTGTGSAASVAHGLGAAPKWVIVKRRNGTPAWQVFHTALGGGKSIELDSTGVAGSTTSVWNNTAPTSSVINIGTHGGTNTSSATYVAYCWAEISGYSKFGSYNGSGSANNAVTGLGFKPAFLMIKGNDVAEHWLMFDNTRSPANPVDDYFLANATNVEETNSSARSVDFDADGFTVDGTGTEVNQSGKNYIYMAFADTREAAFFKDVSTNGNHWTPVNLDYRDSVPDTPTNNFAVLNPLIPTSSTTAEGNLKANLVPTNTSISSTFAVNSGKWYAEFVSTTIAGYALIGISSPGDTTWQGNSIVLQQHTGDLLDYGDWVASNSSLSTTYTVNDVIGIALDLDGSTIEYFKNGSSIGSATIALGTTNTDVSFLLAMSSASATGHTYANFGQDSSFSGLKATTNSNADGNGHGSFAYAPPSGYLALCSQNLPDVDIIDGTDNFNTVLYTGNAADRDITGVGFSPDWVWVKNRSNAYHHGLFDSVRGANKVLKSSDTSAEATFTEQLTSFNADGFSVGDNSDSGNYVNISGHTYAAWNWLAGTAFSNDASATSVGSVDSSGQVNTKAGFSIITHIGTGSTATVAHGLGVKPDLIIHRNRDTSHNWKVYHSALGATKALELDQTTAAATSSAPFNNTEPTSTVMTVNNNQNNQSGDSIVSYVFANTDGYLKAGSYTGNGANDGAFVFTGFRPAWVLIRSSGVGHWLIFDDVRHPTNVNDARLYANLSNAEDSSYSLDLLSNGFKLRHTGSDFNSSGVSYVYLAFAESPFKFANAR